MTARRAKSARPRRSVYFFGDGRTDGRADMRDLLGGKGANLAEMTRLGVPVPPGFTLSTEVCHRYDRDGGRFPTALREEVHKALARVERIMDAGFGDADRPLLLSVRSGSPVSMPGMMDTVLNLGLGEKVVAGLARRAGARFAYDSYRRFIQMYGDVVLGVPHERFEACLESVREARGVLLDTDLDGEDLERVAREYLEIVRIHTGAPFPQDPGAQLWGSIGAVFRSWKNERAVRYRRLNGISESLGTAVNVQAMVFGNMGDDCATGVAFTRDPNTGAKVFYGEYLKNAQGEDVVAGIRTPQPINEMGRNHATEHLPTLEQEMPRAYRQLLRISKQLEKHYRDMQDIEFTIQQGRLWMLQTRTGKRTATAAVQIAVDLVRERLLSREQAVCRIRPQQLDNLLHPTIDPKAKRTVAARGLPASPGAAVGAVVFTADAAEARTKAGEKVILVRTETSPDDIHGLHAAQGVLTTRGGMTSHAAVVARGMGKPCVVGCGDARIDEAKKTLRLLDQLLNEGDVITLDGASGEVMCGALPTVMPELGGAFSELMRWADRLRRVHVRANADTPQDARVARQFGAEGIGLCRTEHMFFEPARILAVQEMILASSAEERAAALAKLLPFQRADFIGIFEVMDGLPVTIRLLDPPLHEFLPHTEEEILEVAQDLGTDAAAVRAKIDGLREFNPMLGHRGCRLGISFPEIYEMQVRAIAEAARDATARGVVVHPEIMIPLVSHHAELERLRALVERQVQDVLRGTVKRIQIRIGTMIEVPRAALTADAIARYADFFSFGTNDLTQMTYALSRDDAGKFLAEYIESGILAGDPFVSIDEAGIGALIEIAVRKGRAVRPDLTPGLCGEHGGDPQSVGFCDRVGLDYVSCSPYRVPIARLAAAQAAVASRRG
ncbi:MAG: pyruvate, phosphate dikinase [Myxococcales bacterium]|nr:pyruvate, phosphate dikinase [Myxococcales bacterium]